ncbi:MAG: SDR family NAD(P)-dependent oxidoreductase, partial [Burkholderiaceae bacterium]|nr:SDR family NAD(P)-dependent oxidoreductase [Burkholderiaceae bacterium]
MTLKDKLAVVTGAASGIGAAIAGKLAEAGATVVVADIQDDRGESRAATLRHSGHNAQFVRVDLTDAASVAAFAADVQARFGTPDVLVNGAGWGTTHPFWEGSPELWDRIIALNFVGPMRLTKAFVPAMIQRGSGRIVNIASDAGRVGSLGETVYSGAKGGLIAFTKS